jgi:uncharacterized Zn finger protein
MSWVKARRRRPPGPGRSRGPFGKTWWGRAWVGALESSARLDPNRLPRGRTYARSGAVDELRLVPGEVQADVQGSQLEPYRVSLRVRQFSSEEWDRVTATLAAMAGHAAALLDGVIPGAVEADLRAQGVSLLPGPGELGPRCSCPDWAVPCKHAAAVCYLVADLLDADPFVIFALRGRGREQLLAGLRARRAQTGGGAGAAEGGVGAEVVDRLNAGVSVDSLARDPGQVQLPPPLPLPPVPGPPSPLIDQLGDDGPIDIEALRRLASDAARRALQLARGRGDAALRLTEDEDLARLAEARIGDPTFDSWAEQLGVQPRWLMRLALAWRAAGARGLAVLEADQGRAPEAELRRARGAMASLGPGSVARADRVTNSGMGLQLRWGGDGLWYLLRRRGAHWELHDPPLPDPSGLLSRAVGEGSGEGSDRAEGGRQGDDFIPPDEDEEDEIAADW